MIPKRLASGIVVLVSAVWAANFMAQFFVASYEPDVMINSIFMAIVGGALALSRPNGKKQDKTNDDGGERR